MENFRTFLGMLWQLLPSAGLASEYHPSTPGGAIPIPFIQSQKMLLDEGFIDRLASAPRLSKPARSFICYNAGLQQLTYDGSGACCVAQCSSLWRKAPAV